MPEQYDRLIEGSRLMQSRICAQLPTSAARLNRLVEAYRLTQTALLGNFHWPVPGGPYIRHPTA